VWSKVFGGTGGDLGYGIAADSNGDVIVTGYFGYGSIDFGGLPLPYRAPMNAYVVKLSSSSGSHIWSKAFSGALGAQQFGRTVTVDAANNVIVAGGFELDCNFGSGSLTSAGANDIFVAAFSPAGGPQWSKRFGGSSSDWATSIVVQRSTGNVGLTGATSGCSFNGVTLSPIGGLDVFTAKFAP